MTISPNNPPRILLLEGIHPLAEKQLSGEGFSVERLETALHEDELIEKLKGFDVVGIRSKTKITEKVISSSPHLLSIGCFCIGTNQVALSKANEIGVPVFNAPYSNTRSVAELVIAEMICLSRQVCDRSSMAHEGKWLKSAKGSNEVRGKTVGIIGYGHIGTQVSILAEGMGLNVIYYDIIKKLPLGNATPVDTLNELLSQSDFVTLHVPETPETKNLMKAEQLKNMKKGGYLINASRGTVVDIPALKAALEEGHVAGAAVDVFPKEPKSNNEEFDNDLQKLTNVILTPHIGGSTEEAQEAIGGEVSESIRKYLKQGSTTGAVNFPELELPPIKDSQRILNIHKNVPGVLGEINSMVSEAGVNIRTQHLSTDNAIGFLVLDIEKEKSGDLAQKIAGLSNSIKTRVL